MMRSGRGVSLSVIAILLCGGWSVATKLTGLDMFLSKFNELYDDKMDAVSTAVSKPIKLDTVKRSDREGSSRKHKRIESPRDPYGSNRKTSPPKPIVSLARSKQPDDTPCSSVEGLWLSSNLEKAFEVTTTAMVGRLDLRAIDSDWTGAMEALFGNDGGPVTAVISQPDTGAAATFVGLCRANNGVDSITGTCKKVYRRRLLSSTFVFSFAVISSGPIL